MSVEILNFTGAKRWHDAGYTGKGIKVLVYEVANPTIIPYADYNGKVLDPLGICFGSIARTHMEDVVDTLLYFAPDVEVHLYRDSLPNAVQYCIDHDIDIFNYSASGGYNTPEFNALEAQAIANGTFFTCAAGNYASEGLTSMSRKDTWLSVGALRMSPDGTVGRTYYSSYDGNGTDLDVMGFGDIIFPNRHAVGETKGVQGTSFADPSVCGMLALHRQQFIARFGRKPTWTETYMYVLENCADLELTGYDRYTGNGVLIMSEVDQMRRVIEVTIGSKNAFVNGEPKTLLDAPYVSPANRTVMGLRDLSNLFGGELILNGQKITIIVED